MDLCISKKFETEKGKPCILVNGYKYREYKILKSVGSIRYRCTNKNCQSSIYVDNNVTKVLSMLNEHNHENISENISSRQIINSRIKRKCENNLFTRPNKIIRQELRSTENDLQTVHSDIKLWRKSMYDFRKKKLPTIPKSLEESKFQLFNLRDTLKTNLDEYFCYMEEISNIVVLTCPTNLDILSRSNHIFADGTFLHSPKYYDQLYTIHTLQDGFYIPLIYCFLTSKSTEYYVDMWRTIIKLCLKLTGINVLISLANCNFHFDFEKSAHNAIKEFFPNSKIMACRFHLGQSWFRKIQSNSDLLKEYNSKSEIGLWLKCFFALGFLPENLVGDGFSCLIENAPTDNFYFSDYIFDNYVCPEAVFPPFVWAGKPSEEARTTNGPESFHRHYNSQFYTSHPSIHEVINILLDIQSETYLKISSIKTNNKNKPRKEQIDKLAFITETWTKLEKNEISLLEYLKVMGPKFCATKL